MAPSSRSPCAGCKFLRRKCTQECVFAPYFPPEDPHRFLTVHNVFGASNVAKLLNALPAQHREDAVSSLVYEAITRLEDPIYGCVGHISVLQKHLRHIKNEVLNARNELSAYIGPAAASALAHPHNSGGGRGGGRVGGGTPLCIPTTLVARPQTQMPLPQNQQEALHNQHIASAISNYEQQEILNSRFSIDGGGVGEGSNVMTAVDGRYNPMSMTGGMPSSSFNPFGAQPAESDHQNPQVSPAAAGASSVHHHYLALEQQQQLYLQQQLGQVSPAEAGASSVHHHHLSLQQQQGEVSPAAAGTSLVDHQQLSLQQQQQLYLQQQQQQQQLYLEQQQGQVSPATAGASSVHHHHLSLQQQQQLYLQQQQQQLYLDQQQGPVLPAAAGGSSVHHRDLSLQQQQQLYLQQLKGQLLPAVAGHHHLSLQQQQQQLHLQQQEGQDPALHLREAGDDKDRAGPSR